MNKRSVPILIALLLAGCLPPVTTTPPRVGPYPPTLPVHYLAVWLSPPVDGATVTAVPTALGAPITLPTTNADGWSGAPATQGDYLVHVTKDGYRALDATVTVTKHTDLHLTFLRAVEPTLPLTTSGPIFLRDGQPWRWKGVSAFGLMNRFAKGEDISGFLGDFKGYNVLRVWPYVTWPGTGWDSPSPDVVIAFLKRAEQAGFYVELTLLTDANPARIDQAKRLVEALTAARPPNLLLEAGNEPETHKQWPENDPNPSIKAIDTAALIPAMQASGFLWTTGNYEDSAKMRGSYGTTHTGRDGEWPRRAHDLLEFYGGGGPNDPSDPAHKVPIVADEPIRPDQAGYNAEDFRAYFATCALLGAGATYHFESGKYGSRPTVEEKRIAAVVLEALDAFPADAPKGPYRRPVESSLRSYVVGDYLVRVRPTTANAPEPGWQPIGTGGILWRR